MRSHAVKVPVVMNKLRITEGSTPRKYSIQTDVSMMTMSVLAHLVEVAFSSDSSLQLAKLPLTVHLQEEAQSFLNGRSLGATPPPDLTARVISLSSITTFVRIIHLHYVYLLYTLGWFSCKPS